MKQKLKALASLCLALALTLCLTLPAWAGGVVMRASALRSRQRATSP